MELIDAGIEEFYLVSVNGESQEVHSCRTACIPGALWHQLPVQPKPIPSGTSFYCALNIEAGQTVDIQVYGLNAQLTSANIRPMRHGLNPVIVKNILSVTPLCKAHLVIEPNGLIDRPLFLFIATKPQEIPRPDDVTLYFGPGEHILGVKSLSSGDRVYIHPDAIVRAHFVGDDIQDVRIFGSGSIDNSKSPGLTDPSPRKNLYGEHRPMLSFRDCKNIQVEGIHLIDSPAWTLQLFNCSEVYVNDLRIVTWRENGDGIDVVNCENVTVENCFLRTWDDSLCIKTQLSRAGDHALLWTAIGIGKSPVAWNQEALRLLQTYATRNVTFRKCVIWLDRAHALEIGFETTGREISNILFEDIDIVHDFHYAPMDISVSDRAEVYDVIFRRICIEDSCSPNVVNLHVGDTYCSVDRWLSIDFGRIQNVTFEDINVHASCHPSIQVHARPLSEPRLKTEFPPLCYELEELVSELVPDGVLKRSERARMENDPLVDNIFCKNWALITSSGNKKVRPKIHYTPDTSRYVGNIEV